MYRYLLLFIFFAVVLYSCSSEQNQDTTVIETEQTVDEDEKPIEPEKFLALDIADINKQLLSIEENLSPKGIMKLYYPKEKTSEGNEQINVSEKTLDNEEIEVQLIHSNMMDDSINSEKYIMLLQKIEHKLAVISIKKNWKCSKNRGHQYWGIESCN